MNLDGLPSGWEAVRWGVPTCDEWCMAGSSVARSGSFLYSTLIVRRIPPVLTIPPGAIAPGWIACDADGISHWWSSRPERMSQWWMASGTRVQIVPVVFPWLQWPENLPWHQRLVEVTQ